MKETLTFSTNIPESVFTLPTPTDIALTPFWTTIQHQNNFILQKSTSPGNYLFRNLLNTIANVLDTKLPPYRILFQREVNTVCLQIAVAENKNLVDSAWHWIETNLMPELEEMDHPLDKERWVTEKMNMLVTTLEYGTDELSSDEKVRNASRTFRQLFDIPHSERFVNYYSCSLKSRQGWLYISENYVGFHSLILGIETKALIELKEIEEIRKEKSKGIFEDSIKLFTKDKEEYYFSNLFKRDEVYDVFVQLTGEAMQRRLKSGTQSIESHSTHDQLISPLKHDLAARKQNELYCGRFRLPSTEHLIDAVDVTYSKEGFSEREQVFMSQVPPGVVNLIGTLYVSQTFLTFESEERLPAPQQHLAVCKVVLPLYTIKRVEKFQEGPYVSGFVVTTWHKMDHRFELHAERNDCEEFSEKLKGLLLNQTHHFKRVKSFMSTLNSEKYFPTDILTYSKEMSGGLGLEFGFPENSKKSKDKSKTKLWKLYFQENGRNLTMVRLPTFGRLVRVGLPSSLRGEIWELTSGAMYLRFMNEGVYQETLEKYKDQHSISTEEIEKDLNRSLPEYPGYQSPEGINRLRRVLTAYAWKNPELGYCQAMNIVVSALLIYTTEEQAFWILHILVDRMCPGYYSTSMYGALLDQTIFDQLVEKTMPILWDHFKKTNVELSIACLPWFLSLYVNCMPLEYAVRILDMLFMEGPKILFQIGLATLKVNGDQLLESKDDGAFLDVFKSFFQAIGKKEVDENGNQQNKLTKFNEVMLTAYREFSLVTNEMISELRKQNQLKVGAGIESFTKRSIIRHLKDIGSFSKEDISIIYDKYFGALYYASNEVTRKSDAKMNREIFQNMLSSMTPWAKLKVTNDDPNLIERNRIASHFIDRVYCSFAADSTDNLLDFQQVILGLNNILHGDLMSHMDWFFELYDSNKDGILDSQDIIEMSKEIYWLLSELKDEHIAWDTAAHLVVNSCEQSDVAKGQQPDMATLKHRLADLTMTDDNTPFKGRIRQLDNSMIADVIDITLPSFRMVILTHESLEMLFDHGFVDSFRVVKSVTDRQKSLGRELFDSLFVDGQKLAKERYPPSFKYPSPSPSPSHSITTKSRQRSSSLSSFTNKVSRQRSISLSSHTTPTEFQKDQKLSDDIEVNNLLDELAQLDYS